jgi:RNA polymerase sigma factor (sigma-70 family)
MSESEIILLERFVRGNDAGAFAEIVRRHAGLVYGTCLRVLADADQAADATQETFFHLLKRADAISESIPGWLHRVAVSKAVDLVRRDARRRRREQTYAGAKSGCDVTWREICPHVDEALDRLDDETRAVLVRHFLEGCSMTALAGELGVSRPTVSRRIEAGLTRLRAQLHKQGITAAAVGLGTLLAENAAQSAPAHLIGQLGKVSLFGAEAAMVSASGGAASSSGLVSSGILAAVNTKLVVAVSAVVVVGAGLLTYTLSSRPPQVPEPSPVAARDEGRSRSQRRSSQAGSDIEQTLEPEAIERDTSSEAVAEKPAQAAQGDEIVEPSAEPLDGLQPSGVARGPEFELDLSSPEATVRSFIRAIATGDHESAIACFLPSGEDYDDMQKMLGASEGEPEYEAKAFLEALDPEAEMPVQSTRENPDGRVKITWEVTFKSEVSVEGHTFSPGDTLPLDSLLTPSGDQWLISSL